MRHASIEIVPGQSGENGVCVHAPVALVSSSACGALLPQGLTEPGVRTSSMAMCKTVSATSVPAVVRSDFLNNNLINVKPYQLFI